MFHRMTSHSNTATDDNSIFFAAWSQVQPAKCASNRLVPALKKPFRITQPIKDEVKIKEHNMSKI